MSKCDPQKTEAQLLRELDKKRREVAEIESRLNDLSHAEPVLQHSEKILYQLALSHTDTIAYQCQLKAEKAFPIFVSENIGQLFGYAPDECLNPDWWFLHIHPEDRSHIADLNSFIKEKNIVQEYRFQHKKGHWIWVRDSAVVIQDTDSNRQNLLGTWMIIDKYKKVEETQAKTNHILRAMSQFQSEFISDVNPQEFFDKILNYILDLTSSEYGFIGEVLYTPQNDPYLKTYAITNIAWNEETRKFYDDFAPGGMEFFNLKTLFGHTLNTGTSIITNQPEADPRRGGLPEGHPALNAFMGLPIYHHNKMIGMLGIANRPGGYNTELENFLAPFLTTCGTLINAYQNEKHRQKIAGELAQNQAHLQAILNTVLDGIISIDGKGIIQAFNASAEQIFGYTSDEVVGQNVKLLMPEPYHSEHDGYLHAHQNTGTNKIIGIGREVQGKKKDGSVFPMDLAVNQVELDGQILYVGLVRDITNRKKHEMALLTSEARFRSLTSLAPVGIYETDTEGNCLFVNERWCELTGLTPEEALGPGWTRALHNDDQDAVFEAWQKAVSQDTEFSEEYRFQKPSGHVVWVSGRAITLTDEMGQPRGYIGTVADITQLKEAERNIIEQEDRIRSLYQVSSQSGLSFEQQLKEALKIGCQRLGLPIGIISHIAHDIYTVESVHIPNNDLERGTTFELEQTYCSIMLKNNQPIAIHHMSESKWHNHPCYQSFQLETYIGAPIRVNNEPYGTLNFTSHNPQAEPFKQSDIEFVQLMAQWVSVAIERYQASQTLATQLTQQKAVLNISRAIQEMQYPEDLENVTRIFAEQLDDLGISFESLSIHRLIDDAQMIFENHTLINLSEYEKKIASRPGIYAELKTQNILYRKDILLPEFQDGLPKNYHKNHTSVRSIIHIPFGNGTVALRSNSPNAFSDNDIALIQSNVETLSVGILRVEDLERLATRNEELEETTTELARSNQELEQFAYVASHDLQEPLRVITNYLQLLDRRFGKSLSEDAKGYITRVTNGAARMSTLIKDLLSYSRITTQAKPFDTLDITQIIENVKSDLEIAISESNAKITYDPLPKITGDETQIKQVFQNLINNAIKFQANTIPQVHISVTETDTHHQFSVSDNGIGIDPEFSERIFEIFQRLHTREEYKGTGIGLAICKKIIERHKGHIWVEPTRGQGATFSFTRPKTVTEEI